MKANLSAWMRKVVVEKKKWRCPCGIDIGKNKSPLKKFSKVFHIESPKNKMLVDQNSEKSKKICQSREKMPSPYHVIQEGKYHSHLLLTNFLQRKFLSIYNI